MEERIDQGNVKHLQQIALEMKNEIITCSLPSWFQAYQPFQPTNEDIDACMKALEETQPGRDGNIEPPLLSNDRWVAFQELPSKRKDGEDVVFAPLKVIGDRIKQVDLGSGLEAAVGSTSKTLSDSNPNTGSDGPRDTPLVTESDDALRDPTAGWSYDSEPNCVIPGEQVDGFFHRLIPELGSLSLSDVSVVCEYEKSTKVDDVIKNRRQLVTAACHVFNQDPVRCVVYGLTIEDDNVSLWYFSRSHSAKSDSFSLLENPRTLVRVFITFLFAKQESLGFDPNIRRILPPSNDEHGLITYVYRLVGSEDGNQWERYYRTRNAICDSYGLCITGRVTRVWEAYRVGSFTDLRPVVGEETDVVLRDAWLAVGSSTEKQIQASIFVDLEKFGHQLKERSNDVPPQFSKWPPSMQDGVKALFDVDESLPHLPKPSDEPSAASRKGYERYFLTIVCDSLGVKSRETAAGFEPAPSLLRKTSQRSASTNKSGRSVSVRGADSSCNNQPPVTVGADLGVIDSNRRQTEAPRAYRAKQRSFLIYDEVCSDLDQDSVTSLQDVLVGLRGCLIALMLLFCAGWVHRDVSCGNVLLWRDPQENLHGKLGDLEYAKKFPPTSDSTAREPKIGTPFFMPAEIGNGEYIKPPIIIKRRLQEPDLSFLFSHRRGDEAEKEEGGSPPSKPEQRQPGNVQHHFAHDLESLWWIAVWAITCRLGIWDNVEAVFIPYLGVASVARTTFILGPSQLSGRLEGLPPSVSGPTSEAMEAAHQWFAESYMRWSAEGPEKRRDAAEHSMGYVKIAELVLQKFSGDVPKLVRMDNPVYKVQLVADDEDAQTDTEHTSGKRSRPDS